jgi:hypothetical protein
LFEKKQVGFGTQGGFKMAKKIVVGLLLVALVCGTTFAVDFGLSAGLGGALDLRLQKIKSDGEDTKRGQNVTSFGVFAFFDATYAEVDLDLLFGGAKVDGEKVGNLTYFGFSVLGKYPIELGSVVLFPLVGVDYQMALSMKPDGVDESIKRSDFDDAMKGSLDSFAIAAGVGADFPLSDLLFIRGEFLWNFRLLSKDESDLKKAMKDLDVKLTNFTSGPRLKVAVGFKF